MKETSNKKYKVEVTVMYDQDWITMIWYSDDPHSVIDEIKNQRFAALPSIDGGVTLYIINTARIFSICVELVGEPTGKETNVRKLR